MEFVSCARKGDCVLHLVQENDKKCVRIMDFNATLTGLLGYKREELLGQSFSEILSKRTSESLGNHLDYEENNLDQVISRMRDFALRTSSGKEIRGTKKIFYLKSKDEDLHYELLIRRVGLLDDFKKFCYSFEGYKQPSFDERLGIMSEASALAEIKMMLSYCREVPMKVTICLADLMESNCSDDKLFFADKVRQTSNVIRKEDFMAVIGKCSLLFFFIDCAEEEALSVCNRIRSCFEDDDERILLSCTQLEGHSSVQDLVNCLRNQIDLTKS